MVCQDEVVRLEYRDNGDYGVVLLHELTPEAVRRLSASITDLAATRCSNLMIEDIPGVEAMGGCSLAVEVGGTDRGLYRVGELAFRCVLTPEGWTRVFDLLEPFSESRSDSGDHFQYLTDDDGDLEWIISTTGRW